MTRKEVNKSYKVPLKVLRLYESWELYEQKEGAKEWQYNDYDLKLLGEVLTILKLGFQPEEAESYMRLFLQGNGTGEQRFRMLSQKRGVILDEIHEKERLLGRLDYMRHNIKNEQEGIT